MSRRHLNAHSLKALRSVTLRLSLSLLGACAAEADAPEAANLAQDAEPAALAVLAAAQQTAAPFRCPGDQIALRASSGEYVAVVDDLFGGLVADSRSVSSWETFTVYAVSQNQVALRANNGWFVAAVGSSLFTTRRQISAETTFTLIPHWNGTAWALQTDAGYFVTAEGGGGDVVNVTRRSVGDWQAFTVVCRSNPTVPVPTSPPPGGIDPRTGLPPGGSTIGGQPGLGLPTQPPAPGHPPGTPGGWTGGGQPGVGVPGQPVLPPGATVGGQPGLGGPGPTGGLPPVVSGTGSIGGQSGVGGPAPWAGW